MTFYVLRYLPEVPMDRRKHASTAGRFPTWLDAEEQRLTQPNKDDLQIEVREDER
ncbi:hypothetical protein GUY44_07605 [Pimelobacter simplex]|uniref:Uncharacterized protein n=1 Tax=Nocardioides simplex TaxID=2045 RepID=A0A0C5XFT4_NOCSI|nr:hypothetical protein [Pimelobacter simplex]AJR18026.1 hypothetical protein KR76_00016 [Pimelobacter simplex]MCG8150340.1 hypothetical protein [Pimelobacter simplex]GEB16707.1 hypothetical protein NSI01_50220 [Pimelobacter simplex]SFM89722.1 hypothetical protein SAMN05421671_4078 [Pimelobacter simplex]